MANPCDFYIHGKKMKMDEFLSYIKGMSHKELNDILGGIPSFKNIPEAPFITETSSWVRLGLKVALKEAVKQGVDKIAWTTGEQQNDRYDLSKTVDKLEWVYDKSLSKPTGTLYGWKEGKMVMEETMPENRLEDYIGKGVAENLLKASENDSPNYKGYSSKMLTGEEIKVGGKGMKGFYGSPE